MIAETSKVFYEHLSQVHDVKMSCDLCGKSFRFKHKLTEHMFTYHMIIKFSCNLCRASFRSDLKLKKHKRLSHNKKYKCEKCDAAYGCPADLANHVKVKHEGKRWYCHYQGCWKSFSCKKNVVRHLRKVHSIEEESIVNYLSTESNDQVCPDL